MTMRLSVVSCAICVAMIYCSNNDEWLKPVIPKWQINPGPRKV